MKQLLALLLLLGFGFQGYANTNSEAATKWTLPPNQLNLLDIKDGPSNITEARFREIIKEFIQFWTPMATAKGATIKGNEYWDNSTVNASAVQYGKSWIVNMYGGLARRSEVKEDGFTLVLCHEIGHHFAGYSFVSNYDWAANEGQSDFFATGVCARAVWTTQTEVNASFLENPEVPTYVKDRCDQVWGADPNQRGLCYRTAIAGKQLGTLLGAITNNPVAPQFETPDMSVVSSTVSGHPAAQCRLDTYFAGALCNMAWDFNVIPGKEISSGRNSPEAEMDARKYSCFTRDGFQIGTRPLCWFKPITQ